eukprot:gnl/MRDRNA2_/MRDRNA2_92446_c0_seq1.p1 gnl/MRDRNA2_/MRDRNA2_92446_c0~~gnl/MRDRNA2_/MRDRNA2_92446_c0_seq1.p1  ORF type:complete len:179 (-),score=45.87 gnl/MRDRNA2_/MRDRNA2_92446_c0_seq1:70-606(-)
MAAWKIAVATLCCAHALSLQQKQQELKVSLANAQKEIADEEVAQMRQDVQEDFLNYLLEVHEHLKDAKVSDTNSVSGRAVHKVAEAHALKMKPRIEQLKQAQPDLDLMSLLPTKKDSKASLLETEKASWSVLCDVARPGIYGASGGYCLTVFGFTLDAGACGTALVLPFEGTCLTPLR